MDQFYKNDKNELVPAKQSWLAGLLAKLKPKPGGQNFAKTEIPKNNKDLLYEYQQAIDQNKVNLKQKPLNPQAAVKKPVAAPLGSLPAAPVATAAPVPPVDKKPAKTLNRWEAPRVLKTNLIQDEMTLSLDWVKNIKLLSINLIGGLLIIGAAYAGLFYYETVKTLQTEQLTGEISEIQRELNSIEKDLQSADVFQKKIKLADYLIKNHIYWTNFFNFLEANTLANVFYGGGFNGNTAGDYNFSATADSFAAVTEQVRAFKASPDVASVDVAAAELAAGDAAAAVNFDIKLKVKPELFKK